MAEARFSESIRLTVGLACLTIAAYWGVWSNDFVNWDDQQYVYENLHVTTGLSWANFTWAWTTGTCSNWHPVTWLSLMLDATLFGPGPTGFHATNLALHLANVLLLFGVLKRFTGELRLSACVAGLFAVHPVHVESVAWVSERKDVLCFFLGLLSLRAYGAYVQSRKVSSYLISLLTFSGSLLAKPMLVTLPCLLLLLDVWPLRRLQLNRITTPSDKSQTSVHLTDNAPLERRASQLILEKCPYLLLTALSCIITYQVQRAGGAVDVHLSLLYRVSNSILAYGHYIRSLLLPMDFIVFHPHARTAISWMPVISWACGLVLITIAAFCCRIRAPFFTTGCLWFLGTLVPVIGIIQVGTQAHADRYLYIPAIGADIAVIWSLAALSRRFNFTRQAITVSMVIVLAVLAIKTNVQTRVWKNSVTLWSHAVKVSGGCIRTQTQLAQSLQAVGQRVEAQKHYFEAFKLQPNNAHLNVNYGLFLIKKNQFAESIPYFQTTLKSQPRDSRALGLLGLSFWKTGDHSQAESFLRNAIQADPDWPHPYYWLGQMQADNKQPELAIASLRQVLRINPTMKAARELLNRLEHAQPDQEQTPQSNTD